MLQGALKYLGQSNIGTNQYDTGEYCSFTISSKTHGDFEVYVDSEDLDKIKDIKWFVNLDYYTRRPYVVNRGRGSHKTRKTISLHRLITDAPKGSVVDHINHNTLDNRKSNLRITNVAGNARNKENVKGYILDKKYNKYIPMIKVYGKRYYGPKQLTPELARAEYLKLKERFMGV
jgi:hypothetical protein